MTTPSAQHDWHVYRDDELAYFTPQLTAGGYTLDDEQPHLKGERFLQQAMTTTGGSKLILLGVETRRGRRVVLKVTRDAAGRAELRHERACRAALADMPFAYATFHAPAEVWWDDTAQHTIVVTEFIEQPCQFLERPLVEQYDIALSALKAQEAARITTNNHFKTAGAIFGWKRMADYERLFADFTRRVRAAVPERTDIHDTLAVARTRLTTHTVSIEQYSDFLTHTDFVPHNFRIRDDILYLLDFSSLRFGNKHESWARFLNFMTLYNPDLEAALLFYVEHNRPPEERTSLQLMRLFRLGEIIAYYAATLEKSADNLALLNRARVDFWHQVLVAELADTRVSRHIVRTYETTRDALRSDDEKTRQKNLH